MHRKPKHVLLLVRLALADLWHDRKVSLCIAASLVAVIAPLLLLFGLKHGVVSQLQKELLNDPRNLEIKLLSSGNYNTAWLDELQQREETGFALGMTRSLNTQADLLGGKRRFVENAEVIPTAANDPLLKLPQSALTTGQVILSARAAERLEASAGDEIRLRVSRRLQGSNELAELPLLVTAVIPAAQFARPAAFVHPRVLMQLERFRDGYQSPELGIDSGKPQQDLTPRYARARLYARDIDSVASLERWLNAQNIETASRLADIESVKSISHVLGTIFGVIAAAALLGCIASLVGAFLANIDRKRRSLSLLRLLGFELTEVAGYIVLQAILLALLGYLGGLACYGLGSKLFDYLLGSNSATGAFICHITAEHALLALLLALLVASSVATIGALRAIGIQPAESLREL